VGVSFKDISYQKCGPIVWTQQRELSNCYSRKSSSTSCGTN